MTTVAEQLDEAARIVREKGWCRGELQRHNGQVCLDGALMLAAGLSPLDMPDHYDALHTLETVPVVAKLVRPKLYAIYDEEYVDHGMDDVEAVWRWNDRLCTGPDDAIAVLMEAKENL